MHPKPPLIDPRDIAAAIGLLTRLPVPVDSAWATARGSASAWAYPVAGAALGLLLMMLAAFASLWLAPNMVAALVLVASLFITGALHEDGLADTADGLWGGWTRERRLEIMKDSRIGAYGVLALGLSLILRWVGLTLIIESEAWWALVALPAASRAAMVPVMGLRHARPDGLSAHVGRPGPQTILLAVALGAIALLPLGVASLTIVLAMAGATLAMSLLALRKIGGQTGDILGATQQVTEIAALVVLSAYLA